MNKKIAAIAVMSLSAGVVLAGCQSIQDQMGAKLAEGIINSSTNGQVKVNLDDVKNGHVTVQTKDGTVQMSGNGTDGAGSVSMTDANGKTVMNASGDQNKVTMTDDTGKTATYTGGAAGAGRPADAPADMPTLDGGSNFSSISYNGTETLNYDVADKDMKGICQKQTDALVGAGWAVTTDGMSLESSDSIMKSYSKGTDTLLLTCTSGDTTTSVGLQKSPKAS